MRLHPAVTADEAARWLTSQARELDRQATDEELAKVVTPFAEAMAAISAVVVDEDPAKLLG